MLEIPESYLLPLQESNQHLLLAKRQWIQTLITESRIPERFPTHPGLSGQDVQALLRQSQLPDLEQEDWTLLSVDSYARQPSERVVPIPSNNSNQHSSVQDDDLGFAEVLKYVSHSNFVNLWRDAFKSCQTDESSDISDGTCPIGSSGSNGICTISRPDAGTKSSGMEHDAALMEILSRLYKCPRIYHNCVSGSDAVSEVTESEPSHVHRALVVVVETEAVHVFKSFQPFSVHQAMQFSPAFLSDSSLKPLFVLYQLLHATREIHAKGVSLGDLSLHDVQITSEHFVSLTPSVAANLIPVQKLLQDKKDTDPLQQFDTSGMSEEVLELLKSLKPRAKEDIASRTDKETHTKSVSSGDPSHDNVHITSNTFAEDAAKSLRDKEDADLYKQFDKSGVSKEALDLLRSLRRTTRGKSKEDGDVLEKSFLAGLVRAWRFGALSNFDYLLFLNHLVGRTFSNPSCYPVLPWVHDFSSEKGGWRDLAKSKFRLNKGDTQLDLTYDSLTDMQVGSFVRQIHVFT